MALLRDLSDEILVDILEFLTCDKATLCTLATVNKKFDGLATQLLARNIDVQVQTQDEALAQKYDSLMSSILQKPLLASSVRTVAIRCNEIHAKLGRPKKKKKLLKDPNTRANELLRELPNIKSLVIDWDDRNCPFTPDYLQHVDHSRLGDITFLGFKTPLNAICDYLSLKSLSSFRVESLDPGSKLTRKRIHAQQAEHDDACLSSMDLGNAHLPYAELRNLLERASTIATLGCVTPGLEELKDSMPFRSLHTTMASYLSPASTALAFSPLQTCLVELNFYDGPITHWPGHDGTRMDMSQFTCLKRLVVPATCFFNIFHSIQRRHIRALLPSSLKELDLGFDFDSYFLYTDDELHQCFPDDRYITRFDLQHSDRYMWLSELAEANKEPNDSFHLCKVRVEERVKHPRGFRYDRHDWALPPFLKELCDDAKMDLHVRLRKPKVRGNGMN